MNIPEHHYKSEMTYPKLKLICIASLSTAPMYVFLVWFLNRMGVFSGSMDTGVLSEIPYTYLLYGALIITLSVPLLLRKVLLLTKRELTPAERYPREFIVFMSYEMSSIFGILLFFLAGYHWEFYFLFLVGIILSLSFFPKETQNKIPPPPPSPPQSPYRIH